MFDLALRVGLPADVDALLELWLVAAENASRPSDSRDAVGVLLQRDPGALLVAEDHGQLIGSVVAGWDGWRAHLYRLAVRPDCRRRGVGRALLEAAEARLRSLGAQRFDAMVQDENQLGHQMWEAAGYRRQGDWGRWVKFA
jgi:ribosomal protein S18 acetylase RimI-like enzyme